MIFVSFTKRNKVLTKYRFQTKLCFACYRDTKESVFANLDHTWSQILRNHWKNHIFENHFHEKKCWFSFIFINNYIFLKTLKRLVLWHKIVKLSWHIWLLVWFIRCKQVFSDFWKTFFCLLRWCKNSKTSAIFQNFTFFRLFHGFDRKHNK